MKKCRYCGDSIADEAIKCKSCQEPLYLTGRLLQLTPLVSVLITCASLGIAYLEFDNARGAFRDRDKAVKERQATVTELQTKDEAASMALRELAQKLEQPARSRAIGELPVDSFRQLEEKARLEPANIAVQKDLYLFKALERQ